MSLENPRNKIVILKAWLLVDAENIHQKLFIPREHRVVGGVGGVLTARFFKRINNDFFLASPWSLMMRKSVISGRWLVAAISAFPLRGSFTRFSPSLYISLLHPRCWTKTLFGPSMLNKMRRETDRSYLVGCIIC